MESKTLLSGIVGFILGGLLVSIAAVATMPQSSTTTSLAGKKGDEFDQAFVSTMISHHQGAIEMAKLSQDSAKHAEIKQLSQSIISTQQKEVDQLKSWQQQWGYKPTNDSSESHMDMSH